jgi:hypothetical protein
MSTEKKEAAGLGDFVLNNIEKIGAALSWLVGQIPSLTIATGWYPLSPLYHPGIYRGYEFFLLVPLMFGLFASWWVIRWRGAMWIVLVLFFAIVVTVYLIYENLPPSSGLHVIGWIASYCAFALLVAVAVRVLIDIVSKLQPR